MLKWEDDIVDIEAETNYRFYNNCPFLAAIFVKIHQGEETVLACGHYNWFYTHFPFLATIFEKIYKSHVTVHEAVIYGLQYFQTSVNQQWVTWYFSPSLLARLFPFTTAYLENRLMKVLRGFLPSYMVTTHAVAICSEFMKCELRVRQQSSL